MKTKFLLCVVAFICLVFTSRAQSNAPEYDYALLDVTVFLQGPLQSNGTMTNYIQEPNSSVAYFSQPRLPINDPYGLGAICYGINNVAIVGKVVDWVKVEIRKVNNPSVVVEERALLLCSDGAIIDEYGESPVFNWQTDPVYLVVKHRNHLSVASNPIYSFSGIVSYDFSTSLSQAYKHKSTDRAPMATKYGKYCMWAGDVSGDGIVDSIDLAMVDYPIRTPELDTYGFADMTMNGIADSADQTLIYTSASIIAVSPVYYWSSSSPSYDYALLDVTVFLQGPLRNDETMTNYIQEPDPNAACFTQPRLPIHDPYGLDGTCLNINNAAQIGKVVDWVKIEVRKVSNPSVIVEERALLLRPNGKIVDVNGDAPVFEKQEEPVYLVVKHHNHLSVASNPISSFSGVISYDFSTDLSHAYKYNPADPNPMVQSSFRKWCMWSGDINEDGLVDHTDSGMVDNLVRVQARDEYLSADITMDGSVDSRDMIFLNSSVRTAPISPVYYWNLSAPLNNDHVQLDVTVFLQGPLQSDGTMTNYSQEHAGSYFTQPCLPPVDFYNLGARCLQIRDVAVVGKVVDWIKVEVRKVNNPSVIVEERALLLRSNGKIVDVNGDVPMFATQKEPVYLVVKHRNHLSVVSNPIYSFSGVISYDFSTDLSQAYKYSSADPAQMVFVNGKWSMWAGDLNGDDSVDSNDEIMAHASIAALEKDRYNLPADVTMNGIADHLDMTLISLPLQTSPISPVYYWSLDVAHYDDALLDLTVFLQGSLQSNGIMTNYIQEPNLNAAYFTQPRLPINDPYGLGVTCPNINNVAVVGKVVDWIKVEVRKVNNPSVIAEEQALLLRPNGKIVDVNGYIPVFAMQKEPVYLVVKHRNHLSVVSNPIYSFSGVKPYDFSATLSQAYKYSPFDSAPMVFINGKWSMWAGDMDDNGYINNTDCTTANVSINIVEQDNYILSDVTMNGSADSNDMIIISSSAQTAPISPVYYWSLDVAHYDDALLDLTVFLQGPLQSNGTMTNYIQEPANSYFTQPRLPLNDPYGLGTTCSNINNAAQIGKVADWIKVEIRKVSNPSVVVEEQALLLRPNGKIVDVNGYFPVFAMQTEPVHIVVKHRNHLSVASNPVYSFSGIKPYDFSATLSQAYKYNFSDSDPMVFTKGRWCMWAGEMDGNGYIDRADINAPYLYGIRDGYSSGDIKMVGLTDDTGNLNMVISNLYESPISPVYYWDWQSNLRSAESTTNFEGVAAETDIQIYQSAGTIQVVSSSDDLIKQIGIYDLQGRMLYNNGTVNADTYQVEERFGGQRVIVVQVVTEKNTKSVKLITSSRH